MIIPIQPARAIPASAETAPINISTRTTQPQITTPAEPRR